MFTLLDTKPSQDNLIKMENGSPAKFYIEIVLYFQKSFMTNSLN